jgi:hypothetical protein
MVGWSLVSDGDTGMGPLKDLHQFGLATRFRFQGSEVLIRTGGLFTLGPSYLSRLVIHSENLKSFALVPNHQNILLS